MRVETRGFTASNPHGARALGGADVAGGLEQLIGGTDVDVTLAIESP